jgi:TIR domain
MAGWEQRERKILEAISEYGEKGQRPRFTDIIQSTGLTSPEAELGFQALLDSGYVTGTDGRSYDGFDYLNIRLLPPGLQALGLWQAGPNINSPSAPGEITPDRTLSLFISHSSKDSDFVLSLIGLLRSALRLPAREIRCTSIDGYRLPVGAHTKEHLRVEIHRAEAFIGVISPNSLKSAYVMFELGARWGAGKHLAPVLAPDTSPAVLEGPLSDINALKGDDPAQLHQLVVDLASHLGLQAEAPHVYQREVDNIAAHTRFNDYSGYH